MIPRFGRPVQKLYIINNYTLKVIYNQWNYLLNTMNQAWLSPNFLHLFADAIYAKGASLDNYWEFIDGTVIQCCMPGINRRIVNNMHKRVYSIKFKSVLNPNCLSANLFGLVEGRKHKSGLFGDSGLRTQRQQHACSQNHNILCL